MAVALHDIQSIQQFDSKDTSGINVRWKRWFRAFELYAEGKDVSDPDQKKSLLFTPRQWMCKMCFSHYQMGKLIMRMPKQKMV